MLVKLSGLKPETLHISPMPHSSCPPTDQHWRGVGLHFWQAAAARAHLCHRQRPVPPLRAPGELVPDLLGIALHAGGMQDQKRALL